MRAKLKFHQKYVYSDGAIVEMKVWDVPKTQSKPEGYKYSIAYINEKGRRVLGIDNAEGKGHHWHERGKEKIYNFKSIEKILKDFYNKVGKIRRGKS